MAERLQIKHHSAVGLINRLEAQNLVSRKKGSGNRRAIHVALTESGEKLLEQLTVVHREELKSLVPQLTVILESLKQPK